MSSVFLKKEFWFWKFVFILVTFFPFIVLADEGYYYGHTPEGIELKVSYDDQGKVRFINNGDGTITDLRHHLLWKKVDSYEEKKEWLNWFDAQAFIKKINEERFAGYNDWRLPSIEELKTLYDESKSIPWKYYWTENEIHVDPIFGNVWCCYWSHENKKEYAYGYNFIRGQKTTSHKGGIQRALNTIRAVRKIKKPVNPDGLKKQ